MTELERVLTPDGILVISTPDKAQSDPSNPNPFHELELSETEFLALLERHFTHVTPHYQGYLHGSVVTGSGAQTQNWKRTGFLDYEEDNTTQRRYILATASNGQAIELPSGMFHDGAIVATLNRHIEALETRIKELEASGAIRPVETDSE